jgi:Holliday junction resolvase RusA-like endonuclease
VVTATEYRSAGLVEIRSEFDPVSLQASPRSKLAFKNAVSEAIEAHTTGVYLGDVEVSFEWFVPEVTRYTSHVAADLDNVLKPFLDALTGPGRLLIDDNQVQSILARWMDPGPKDCLLIARVQSLSPDEMADREGLYFKEVRPKRGWPLFERHRDYEQTLVDAWEAQISAYEALVASGVSHDDARGILPIQRSFPRARLGKFRVE